MRYQDAVSEIWRHYDLTNAASDCDYTNLVKYATLAASSHNTQPWKFRLEPGRISIFPDLTRRCPAVDLDDHHLYVSLGCAATNLTESALSAGLSSRVSFDQTTSAVQIDFEKGPVSNSRLFNAIPQRQCSRTLYDGSKLTLQELQQLESVSQGTGVSILLLTDQDKKQTIIDYVAKGNMTQMSDSSWMNELKTWIRCNESHAVATGDGLYSRSMGNPDMPTLLANLILRFVIKPEIQNKKDEKYIQSSSGIAVFFSGIDDKAYWVEVGRCYERFALQATVLGVQTAFINSPVEVPELRTQFANWLGIGECRPDLIVRFGRGPVMPHSLRRPVEDVLVDDGIH
ncbi:MAG: Tat pathway signal protein [Cyanobacteria bacterium P01_B01_bin.77]